MPKRGIFKFDEPGISFNMIVRFDLQSLYYLGENYIAMMQKLLGSIRPILG